MSRRIVGYAAIVVALVAVLVLWTAAKVHDALAWRGK